jgi:hypothetical protein
MQHVQKKLCSASKNVGKEGILNVLSDAALRGVD